MSTQLSKMHETLRVKITEDELNGHIKGNISVAVFPTNKNLIWYY